jgi:hypothetical protein
MAVVSLPRAIAAPAMVTQAVFALDPAGIESHQSRA